MEIVLVAIVIMIILSIGVSLAVSVVRESTRLPDLPILDRLRAFAESRLGAGSTTAPAANRPVAVRPVSADVAATSDPSLTSSPARPVADRLSDEVAAAWRAHEAALARLDGRLDRARSDLERTLARELDALRRDLAADRDRIDVALRHLQTAVAPSSAATPAPAPDRQADTLADLYARLARLEAALAAATSPALLPGEPYAPPADLPADALVWDHWKDVGDRAFALADAFNAGRLHLPPPLAADVAAFLTRLRAALTDDVYPNLRPNPAPEHLAALHAALGRLATDLPSLRARLEHAYRFPAPRDENDRAASTPTPA